MFANRSACSCGHRVHHQSSLLGSHHAKIVDVQYGWSMGKGFCILSDPSQGDLLCHCISAKSTGVASCAAQFYLVRDTALTHLHSAADGMASQDSWTAIVQAPRPHPKLLPAKCR